LIGLVVVLIVALLALSSAVFLLGFRLGGGHWKDRLSQVRMEGAQAERQLHDLTRQAFVAMAEEAQWRGPSSRRGDEGDSLNPQQ
jgi:hypothetical protein